MSETIMSVAIITALFSGSALFIKAIFGKNENKSLEYQHQEKLIELVSQQNTNSEKLVDSVNKLREDFSGLREEVISLNERVIKLEKEKDK